MPSSTLTSREFNQDVGRAKRAAALGPVIVTDRGKPSHVLLSIEEYHRLTGGHRTLADGLALPDSALIDLEPTKAEIDVRVPDFDR